MVTFKDIEKANSTIKTMTISRWDKKKQQEITKEYAEVNQRIKAFRMLYPEGFIRTQILSHEDGVVVMQTIVGYTDETGEKILGTGLAFEDKKNGLINGTSYIENCETSAVGRALGMCGLGIDISVASYEEVNNAMSQQEQLQPVEAEPPKKTAKKPPVCESCKNPVVDDEGYTVAQIVKATKKTFGHTYCMACAHEAKKAQEQKKKQEEQNLVTDPELQLPFPIEE